MQGLSIDLLIEIYDHLTKMSVLIPECIKFALLFSLEVFYLLLCFFLNL
jgi:hypothetical protein